MKWVGQPITVDWNNIDQNTILYILMEMTTPNSPGAIDDVTNDVINLGVHRLVVQTSLPLPLIDTLVGFVLGSGESKAGTALRGPVPPVQAPRRTKRRWRVCTLGRSTVSMVL